MSNCIHTLNIDEAKALLDQNQAILIDVREPGEYNAEHIDGAINIPLSTLTADGIKAQKTDGKKILIHCKSGARSTKACNAIITDVGCDLHNVAEGISGWQARKLPTIKSANDGINLPLDRQVQLVISLMILSGLLIFYTLSPYGLILPLFAGLGLLNAALTGWCGMGMLIAKMPWNQ